MKYSRNLPARWMVELPKPAGYLLAGLVALAASALYELLHQYLNPAAVALMYLLPVIISATFWGLGPGIVSAGLSFLGYNFFFIEPYHSLAVRHTQDLIVLISFLAIAIIFSQLMGTARQGLAAASARELEALRLYEMTRLLSGANNSESIARVLANQSEEIFPVTQVQVFIEEKPSIVVRIPEQGLFINSKPDHVIPIQTSRQLLGEISLWMVINESKEINLRLLETLANQGALALEKVQLLKAAQRAQLLEENDHFKTSLLSSVSHELRTPLATIKASASSLRSGEVDWESDARLDLLSAIEEESDHLNLLVGNLLDMSRIESGALKPNREANSLSEIISSSLYRMKLQSKEHNIEINIPDEFPLLDIDFIQIGQVFDNLISNSVKYSPSGTKIIIIARNYKKHALVSVSNEGPGVPEEQLERIFDKFYRGSSTQQITGSGLGLSICKGIIEAHAGKIWAENIPGGFSYHFTLPRD